MGRGNVQRAEPSRCGRCIAPWADAPPETDLFAQDFQPIHHPDRCDRRSDSQQSHGRHLLCPIFAGHVFREQDSVGVRLSGIVRRQIAGTARPASRRLTKRDVLHPAKVLCTPDREATDAVANHVGLPQYKSSSETETRYRRQHRQCSSARRAPDEQFDRQSAGGNQVRERSCLLGPEAPKTNRVSGNRDRMIAAACNCICESARLPGSATREESTRPVRSSRLLGQELGVQWVFADLVEERMPHKGSAASLLFEPALLKRQAAQDVVDERRIF